MHRIALITALTLGSASCAIFDVGTTEPAAKDRGNNNGGGGQGRRGKVLAAPGNDGCAAFDVAGRHNFNFDYNGETYEMPVTVPPGKGPRRAVVLLHGGKGGPGSIVQNTKFFDRSGAEGYIAVAPGARSVMLPKGEARERWRNGDFDNDPAVKFPRDDVGFLDALAKNLKADFCVDKLLAVGFSNGGSMGHRWMCEGNELDALVSAAGTLQIDSALCDNKKKPVLEYIGTLDRRMNEPPSADAEMSALETLDYWSDYNGCTGKPEVTTTGDTQCNTWSNCTGGAETRLCVITGLGHAFPSDQRCDLEGTDDAWSWFESVVP